MIAVPPAVSVVLATRNRRRLLSEAIATIKEQTLADWELVVIDDASTDDTADWLATECDGRVRIFRQTVHRERSAARNRGLAEARAPYVMFLDDDDLLRPGALAELKAALDLHPDAIAASGACRILMENGDSVKVYRPARPARRVIWKELLFGWWAGSGQVLYRSCVIRDIDGYESRYIPCEDRALWLRIARNGPVCLVPSVMMEYRLHAGQCKPPNIPEIRHAVWNDFMATLPPSERAEAARVRRAARLVEASEEARAAGKFGRALASQLAACWTAPHLLRSPLTARPMWWEIKKSLLRERGP